jgi:hypothetical protein
MPRRFSEHPQTVNNDDHFDRSVSSTVAPLAVVVSIVAYFTPWWMHSAVGKEFETRVWSPLWSPPEDLQILGLIGRVPRIDWPMLFLEIFVVTAVAWLVACGIRAARR